MTDLKRDDSGHVVMPDAELRRADLSDARLTGARLPHLPASQLADMLGFKMDEEEQS